MAFLIDQLNNSGLFAQSAYSASIATCDSDGNIITATYITGVDLTPYQTTAGMTAYATTGDVANKLDTTAFNIPASSNWNSTYDTVQSNSGSWGGGGTIESYNLSAGKYINITKDDVNSAIGIETTGLNVTNWNSNYDTVTANSGAWGGQTLPISAGPGIKLDVVNGTLVASNDETVLWEGTRSGSVALSEPASSFDYIRIDTSLGITTVGKTSTNNIGFVYNVYNDTSTNLTVGSYSFTNNKTELKVSHSKTFGMGQWAATSTPNPISVTNNWDYGTNIITKVVGINRINNG